MEREGGSDTNHSRSTWNNPKESGKETERSSDP